MSQGPISRKVMLPSGALGVVFEAGSTKVIELHERSPLRGLVQPGERIVAFKHGAFKTSCTSGRSSTDTGLIALLNAHKHEPGRSVTVRGNAHLGQTSQTFHVQVPPGAGPGQTLQAQAPNGVTLQVQIPQGSAPGTTFEVATPAMPVDVTVAPPTAQVSPAPMEMERATAWECETDTGWSEYGADIAAQLESAFGARAAVRAIFCERFS